MNVFGILTLVGVGIAIAAIAAYLIMYLLALRKTAAVLDTVNAGVRAIARRVEPLSPVLVDVNTNLAGAQEALAGVLGRPPKRR